MSSTRPITFTLTSEVARRERDHRTFVLSVHLVVGAARTRETVAALTSTALRASIGAMLEESEQAILVTSRAQRIRVRRTRSGVLMSIDNASAELSLPEVWELTEALDRLSTAGEEEA